MKAQSAAIGWTTTLNSPIVNEVRFGWGRNNSVATQDPFGLNTLAELGFRGVQDSPFIVEDFRDYHLRRAEPHFPGGQSGFDRLGSPDFYPNHKKQINFSGADALEHLLSRAPDEDWGPTYGTDAKHIS